jgi:large subunit ribosomal protein L9
MALSPISNCCRHKAQGFDIDRKTINLHDPIKQLGEYAVPVKLHPEVVANVKVAVVAA